MTRTIAVVALAAGLIVPRLCAAQTPQPLSRQDAERIAVASHPQVRMAEDLAAAASAQEREAKAPYYPMAFGSLTAADALSNSRIAAGGLNNPIILDRYSNGLTVSQLVTDFGRTSDLVKSASFSSQAQQQRTELTRADILLRVDEAYFAALKAQAVLKVADDTVRARQASLDQATALARNQIKSDLDVSFASVDLTQAQLLLLQAQNDVQSAFAELSDALGYPGQRTFSLVDEPTPAGPPTDVDQLTASALRDRPELVSQRFAVAAAESFVSAQHDLWRPTISFVASAGYTPIHQSTLTDRYAAAGFNVNVPIFNGHLFGGLEAESAARFKFQQDRLQDLQDQAARDVRIAWLNATSAFQRMGLADQFVTHATQAFNLAQSRYQLGLSTIVELDQAQLNLTQAQISQASARYDYAARLSILDFEIGKRP